MRPHFAERAILLCALVLCMLTVANAQTTMQTTTDQNTETSVKTRPASETKSDENKSELKEVIQLLREQQRELETLRQQISEQARTIEELRQRVEKGEQTTQTKTAGPTTASSSSPPNDDKAQQKDQDERLARVEAQAKKTTDAISKQLGSITFNGDLRLRYESFYGQLNSQTNASNPAILGNELSSRQRFRFRARFGMKGQIGDTVEWGLRFASGNLADPISTNQSFTDFFNRKAFELDQAYIAWTPKISEGSKVLRFQAGKFEMPWTKTELTFDSDLNVEGFSESYRLNFKNRPVENISFMAWQLPFLERNSGFVRNANGTVNVDETRRAGRDLALYGGQIQAGFKLGQDSSLTLSLADQYFSGTQFITPIQLFGSNLLIPVTITIPATSTSPAQTVTTQVSIPREFLVSGVNLGVSTASNNATNRDGRLSSGFNLVDVIARLNLWTKSKVPVMMILDYVRNTQTHPVLLAGPGGSNLSQPNNENSGYWAEIQLGKNKARGDWLLGYTLIRIEKDAVLTPFNYSDTVQQSDVRAHRVVFNYMVDPRVTFSFTGVFSQRPNGLSGVFGNTPARSLNRATTRLQFDTIFKF